LIRRIEVEPVNARRTKLWELHSHLHCSIIGTCLSTRELRSMIARFVVVGGDGLDEHDLHKTVVQCCAAQSDFSRHVNRTLDKRHHNAIHQFARRKTPDELRRGWEDAIERGEIPGAYWATLSHPAATEEIVTQAFGAVHMLSHLVGASNRADIRKLRQIEREKEELVAKIERQEAQLREGFIARDRTIRELNDALALRAAEGDARSLPECDRNSAPGRIADLEQRLSNEIGRRDRAERKLAESEESQIRLAEALAIRDGDTCAMRAELETVEGRLTRLLSEEDGPPDDLDLRGLSILYVGGRANQIAHLRTAASRAGAELLDHDGGIDDRDGRLPGLVSRADVALFPVDCISHTAALALKRLCQQAGKPWMPLRTASLTCFLAAMTDFAASQAACPANPSAD
jgi:hypothetical protein